jgi:hypothetical protein
MQKILKELVVFMASPSDLSEERQVLRATEDELNYLLSRFGIRVRVVGWELTPPGYGRAQEQINPLVHDCDVFIGLLNKRWGTATGDYSSGFEEEFEIALRRRKIGDTSPAIGMFFAQVSKDLLSDPGPQLSKVIEFKNRVQAENLVLYGEFSSADQLGKRVLNFLLDHLLPLVIGADYGPAALETTGTSTIETKAREAVSRESEDIPLNEAAAQIAVVMQGFMSAMQGKLTEDTDLDFDRLALFARALERQPEPLATHLVNRLYRRLDDFELTEVEATIWLRTFFSDVGQSKSPEDRKVPGWALLDLKDGALDHLERRLVSFAQHEDPSAARGAVQILADLQLRPETLWQRHEGNTDTSDDSTAIGEWSKIFETLSGVNTAFNYLLSQLRPEDSWLIRDLAKSPGISGSSRDALRALEKALGGDFSELVTLAPYHFAKDTDSLAEYLATNIKALPLERLDWLARFAAHSLRRAAIRRLLDEDELKGPPLREALAWKDKEAAQMLSAKAVSDPALGEIMLEMISSDRSKDFPRDLEPTLLAALRSTEELQAFVESSPLNYRHWEALSIQLGEAMLDKARQILDTDAADLRIALARFAEEDPATIEFVVENFRASASVCIGNNGQGEEDALRLAREVGKGQLVSPPLALVALSNIATPEQLPAIQRVLPALDVHSLVEDAELLMSSNLAPVLAEVWESSEIPRLRENARLWFIRQPNRTLEELKEALHDDVPTVRMSALHALAARDSRDQLEALLVEYSSGRRKYWYNVIAGLDQILHEPTVKSPRVLEPAVPGAE